MQPISSVTLGGYTGNGSMLTWCTVPGARVILRTRDRRTRDVPHSWVELTFGFHSEMYHCHSPAYSDGNIYLSPEYFWDPKAKYMDRIKHGYRLRRIAAGLQLAKLARREKIIGTRYHEIKASRGK
jgi:hypothetical protein